MTNLEKLEALRRIDFLLSRTYESRQGTQRKALLAETARLMSEATALVVEPTPLQQGVYLSILCTVGQVHTFLLSQELSN